MKYTQRHDGERFAIGRKHRFKCCDCALVHDFDFRLRGNVLTVKATRNKRATAAARRKR